jgi:hypothetical protein
MLLLLALVRRAGGSNGLLGWAEFVKVFEAVAHRKEGEEVRTPPCFLEEVGDEELPLFAYGGLPNLGGEFGSETGTGTASE